MINTQILDNSQLVSQNVTEYSKKVIESQVLQKHYRVAEINSTMLATTIYLNIATFQANETSLKASWISAADCSKYQNQIVSPKFSGVGTSNIGCLPVTEVTVLTEPASINIFETIPVEWVKDRGLVTKARQIFEQLPCYYKMLFNAILWDAERFHRFCICPSSLSGHDSEINGNLRHTVEVCEKVLMLTELNQHANHSFTLFCGMIHDVGKADEYKESKYGWQLSDIGKLHGHKVTALKWIIEAMTKYSIQLPERHYDGVIHMMTAQPNAPDWMGIRPPLLTESFLLSMADRLSGHVDLMDKTLPSDAGQGLYHKHLKGAYYKIGN